MADQQRTIAKEFTLSGRGLHTGNPVKITVRPSAENTGITFVRVDLPGAPRIRVGVEAVRPDAGVPRCTTIGSGNALIHTVEHLMSTLCGLGIDNLTIDIDANELPALDGSGLGFLQAIQKAGVVEQAAERQWIDIKEPLVVSRNGSSITILPDTEFKISYLLDYRHPHLTTQFFSTTLDQEHFAKEIAPCRTFCLEEEANELRKNGLGMGANYENSLIVGAKGVINNKLRFPDEFARHKVLDFIGDLYLLGRPIRGNVVAVKSGHKLNLELLKRIHQQNEYYEKNTFIPQTDFGATTELDIHQIMKILPHRYPFLFVDRIVHLEKGKKAVGIKNVTMNDNFFPGHFPTRPVMPGVLMVEALAQTGGVLVLTSGEHHGKVALFMAADNVKFRRLVVPGEQLELEVEILRDRAKTAHLKGTARVNGEIAVETEMLFSYVDASFLEKNNGIR